MPFDIRQWRRQHGLPERLDDPDVIERVTRLLGRDLSERLAASGESPQPRQGRTGRRNGHGQEHAGSQPA